MTLADFNAYLHFDGQRCADGYFVSRVLIRGAARRGNRFIFSFGGL